MERGGAFKDLVGTAGVTLGGAEAGVGAENVIGTAAETCAELVVGAGPRAGDTLGDDDSDNDFTKFPVACPTGDIDGGSNILGLFVDDGAVDNERGGGPPLEPLGTPCGSKIPSAGEGDVVGNDGAGPCGGCESEGGGGGGGTNGAVDDSGKAFLKGCMVLIIAILLAEGYATKSMVGKAGRGFGRPR